MAASRLRFQRVSSAFRNLSARFVCFNNENQLFRFKQLAAAIGYENVTVDSEEDATTITQLQSVVGAHSPTVASFGTRVAYRIIEFHVFGEQELDVAETTASAARFENVERDFFDVLIFAELYRRYAESL